MQTQMVMTLDTDSTAERRSATASSSPRRPRMNFELGFGIFLVFCLCLLTFLCSVKMMSFDEMLSLYTEKAPSVSALLANQRSIPVSLDPPLAHLLGHWALSLGFNPVFSVRLPSLFGIIGMFAGVYIFTRRLAGVEAAALAAVAMIITEHFHMAEARPYGLLLGATALALVLWQNVLRGNHRRLSLVALFLALGVATSSHYFGILVAGPLLIAELIRTRQRRAVDLPLLAVLFGSSLFAAGWLPFLKGAHQYKSSYYTRVGTGDFARAYAAPFMLPLHVQSTVLLWLICLASLALIAAGAFLGYRMSRLLTGWVPTSTIRAEWIAIVALALLPVFGVVLAEVASGAFESRYVVEFTLGISIALSAGLMSLVRAPWMRRAILLTGCLFAVAALVHTVLVSRANAAAVKLLAHQTNPQGLTVMTDKEEFLWLHLYHAGTPGVTQASWVADMNREIAASGSDNIDRTMLNLKAMAGLPVLSFEDLEQGHQTFRLIEKRGTMPPNWIQDELRRRRATLLLTDTIASDTIYQVSLAPK